VPNKNEVPPLHITGGRAVIFKLGLGNTANVNVLVDVQSPLAPVIVYTVVLVGETTTLVPVNDPGIHEKDPAPEAVKVAELPLQIIVGDAVIVIVGVGVTNILTVCELTQLKELLAATEKVVVTDGVTTIVLELELTGDQV
jgi:hypothetical protein